MIQVVALLVARDGDLDALRAYERQVLPLVAEHGGRLITAFEPVGREAPEAPDEVHVLEFPSEAAFASFRDDPRRAALAEQTTALSKATVFVSARQVEYDDS